MQANISANTWTRSDRPRRPAVEGGPLVDPAEWYPEDFTGMDGAETWIYRLSDAELAEIRAAVSAVEVRGLDLLDIAAKDFPLPTLAARLGDIRAELMDGRGFALVRGLPVEDMTRPQTAAAFWGIGAHLGRAVPQNAKGHMLGHVKDIGEDYAKVRGYMTRAHMAFHADQCDILALCCLHPAKSGGTHRISSSVALYNEMLRRRPDLPAELCWPFYCTRNDEIPAGEKPWFRQAVFNFHDGYFAARGVSARLSKAQALPGVPPFTPAQIEAMALYREIAAEQAMDIEFQRGDMSFVMNHVTLHSRTEFEDWPEPDRKRHMLRLWLSTGARPLSPKMVEYMSGICVDSTPPVAPLDV